MVQRGRSTHCHQAERVLPPLRCEPLPAGAGGRERARQVGRLCEVQIVVGCGSASSSSSSRRVVGQAEGQEVAGGWVVREGRRGGGVVV